VAVAPPRRTLSCSGPAEDPRPGGAESQSPRLLGLLLRRVSLLSAESVIDNRQICIHINNNTRL
jgi:hypothetical protein